jgi:hypothetical protein
MSRFEDACPFSEPARANRCKSCESRSNGLPPCVAAYLSGSAALQPENVIPLFRVEVAPLRKAA